MIKFFRKIHLWLSVPFGIIITLICFSGAMLVFEPEVTRMIQHDIYYVPEVKGEPLSVDELTARVEASLPEGVEVKKVTTFTEADRTYQVSLSKPRRASVFVSPYTGEITGKSERIAFFSTMFKLHRWLLDSSNPHGEGVKVGKTLVGISTLIFVIALISGVVIWWPRARKNLRRSLSITFENGWRSFWKGLHVAGGMYVLIIVLIMALTGLTWSFGWYRTAFYALCGGGDGLRHTIMAIHTGSFGGIVTRILWFVAALLGATLPLTGYYIWIRHLLKKRKAPAAR